MFGGQRKRRKKAKKVKAGDGSALKPFRSWQLLWRTVFLIDLPLPGSGDGDVAAAAGGAGAAGAEQAGAGEADAGEAGAQQHQYAVNVDYTDWKIYLYRDGLQHAKADSPAVFPVPGGYIEAATSLYGMRTIDFVAEDESRTQLTPARGTGEWRRARFAHRHPGASRVIGGAAVVILLTALVVLIPQLAAQISQVDWVAQNIGSFSSPLELSSGWNTALTVAGLAAAIERALSLRNHWLIDFDTYWLGD